MLTKPHASTLRKGRYSICNGVYLITAATYQRIPHFENLWAGRIVVNAMRDQASKGAVQSIAFVVMPDHFHWLVSLTGAIGLPELMRSVKGYSSHCLQGYRGRNAAPTRFACRARRPVWQEGYHDHALRREEDIKEVARYVVMNPVRAGLVASVWDYPLWDAVWVE